MTNAGQNTTLAGARAFLFYSWTLLLSVPLFVVMLVQAPFTLLFDKVRWASAGRLPILRKPLIAGHECSLAVKVLHPCLTRSLCRKMLPIELLIVSDELWVMRQQHISVHRHRRFT